MLINAPAKNLAKAASAAAEMSSPNSPQMILGSLLLTAGDGVASFAGANLEGHMTVTIRAEETEPGSVAVDGRIAKLLAGFPDGAIAEITMASDAVTLQCGRSHYRLETLPAEGFPTASEADEATKITLSDDDRRRLFATPAPAISTERTRYYLCGLGLKSVGGRLTACGTNGTQLIRASIEAAIEIPAKGVIIPGKACAAIARLDGCTIKVGDKAIEATTDTYHFSHKLIDATFVAYERAIPAPSGNTVEVDRLELIAALKRLLCVGTQEKTLTKIARLEWNDDELSLTLPRQPDAAADVLPALTGGSGKTGVAVGDFIGLLGTISAERVVFDAADPGSAIRITLPGDDDFIAVQMPCRV